MQSVFSPILHVPFCPRFGVRRQVRGLIFNSAAETQEGRNSELCVCGLLLEAAAGERRRRVLSLCASTQSMREEGVCAAAALVLSLCASALGPQCMRGGRLCGLSGLQCTDGTCAPCFSTQGLLSNAYY